jgi:hypothetical protein
MNHPHIELLSSIESRVLRRMCEPKGDEVTEGWRKLHDNELRQKLLGTSSD